MHAQSLGLEDSEGSTADMSELHTLQKMPDCFVSFRMLRSAKYAVADSEFDIKMLICPRQHWIVHLHKGSRCWRQLSMLAEQDLSVKPLLGGLQAFQVLLDSIWRLCLGIVALYP